MPYAGGGGRVNSTTGSSLFVCHPETPRRRWMSNTPKTPIDNLVADTTSQANVAKTTNENLKPDGGCASSQKKIIDEAIQQIEQEFPEMFSSSSQCRIPHLNADSFRDTIFESDVMNVRGFNSAEDLKKFLQKTNQMLAERNPQYWKKLLSSRDGEELRVTAKKALKKAKKNNFYLGLEKRSTLVDIISAKPEDNIKKIIDEAIHQIEQEFPKMFSSSSQCRVPHLNAESFRDTLLESDVVSTMGFNNAEALKECLHQTNQMLAERDPKYWKKLLSSGDGGELTAVAKRALKRGEALGPLAKQALRKAKRNNFYLGLEKKSTLINIISQTAVVQPTDKTLADSTSQATVAETTDKELKKPATVAETTDKELKKSEKTIADSTSQATVAKTTDKELKKPEKTIADSTSQATVAETTDKELKKPVKKKTLADSTSQATVSETTDKELKKPATVAETTDKELKKPVKKRTLADSTSQATAVETTDKELKKPKKTIADSASQATVAESTDKEPKKPEKPKISLESTAQTIVVQTETEKPKKEYKRKVHLSYSKLKAFTTCPKLYALRYVENEKREANHRQMIGEALHHAVDSFVSEKTKNKKKLRKKLRAERKKKERLARIAAGEAVEEEDEEEEKEEEIVNEEKQMIDTLKKKWNPKLFANKEEAKNQLNEAVKLLKSKKMAMLQKDAKQEVEEEVEADVGVEDENRDETLTETEKRFRFKIDHVRFTGTFDRVDYLPLTHKPPNSLRDMELFEFKSRIHWKTLVMVSANLQLQFYSAALLQLKGDIPKKAVLEEIGTSKRAVYIPTSADVDGVIKQSMDVADSIGKESFEATPSFFACRNCEFRNKCPDRFPSSYRFRSRV